MLVHFRYPRFHAAVPDCCAFLPVKQIELSEIQRTMFLRAYACQAALFRNSWTSDRKQLPRKDFTSVLRRG